MFLLDKTHDLGFGPGKTDQPEHLSSLDFTVRMKKAKALSYPHKYTSKRSEWAYHLICLAGAH